MTHTAHSDNIHRKATHRKTFRLFAPLFAAALLVTTGPLFADGKPASKETLSHKYEKRYDHDRGRHDDRGRDHDRRDEYNRHDRYDHHDRYDRHDEYDRHHKYDRRRPGYYYHNRYDHNRYEYYRRGHFEIPRLIGHEHRDRYSDYYYGRSYYADHNHYHTIYRFPVFVDSHWVYKPYAYCEGAYFATGYFSIDGPRFSIRFGF